MPATVHTLRPRHLAAVPSPADELIGPATAHLIQAALHAASSQRHLTELAQTALDDDTRMELTLLAGAQGAIHNSLTDLVTRLAQPEATA